jgi:hypothetical protein
MSSCTGIISENFRVYCWPQSCESAATSTQFGLNVQAVSALDYPAGQHRPYIQLSSDLFGFCFASLVAENPAAGHYPQLGDLREAVDQVLRDAVAEIFGVAVGAHVHERHHCQGVDRLWARREVSHRYGRNRDHRQSKDPSVPGIPVHGERGRGGLRRDRAAGIRVPLQTLQIRAQFRSGLAPHVSILLQRLADDMFQFRGQIRLECQRRQRFVQDGVKQDRRRVSQERRPARGHLIEHHAEREQICASCAAGYAETFTW